MNKETKKMAKIICKVCSQCDLDCMGGKANFPCALAEIQAEKLYDAGYRKIVWHQVAADDLPNKPDCYYCYYAGNSRSGYHVMLWDGENFPAEYASKVVAWMALPKYGGEEKCHTK